MRKEEKRPERLVYSGAVQFVPLLELIELVVKRAASPITWVSYREPAERRKTVIEKEEPINGRRFYSQKLLICAANSQGGICTVLECYMKQNSSRLIKTYFYLFWLILYAHLYIEILINTNKAVTAGGEYFIYYKKHSFFYKSTRACSYNNLSARCRFNAM